MGALLIDQDSPSFERGIAHVWIEAPAPADARAKRIAETRLEGLSHRFGRADKIPFAIHCAKGLPANARLRAWVDVQADGSAGPEDLYSIEAVTVSDDPCVVRVENSSSRRERGGP